MLRNPVQRTLLIAGGLLLSCVALVAWDYGLARERASTGSTTRSDVPFALGVDGDADVTYPERRVDVFLTPIGEWGGFINVSVGPNTTRAPQRIVLHLQVPGVLIGATPLPESPPDSLVKRHIPGGAILDIGITVPPQTAGKAVSASFAVRSLARVHERLGVFSVRLARGSPLWNSRLGSPFRDDGLSPPPTLYLHPGASSFILREFVEIDGTPVPDFREPGGGAGWRLDVPALSVAPEPIEATLTNQLIRFLVAQIPQLASVAAGLLLGLLAQPMLSRKNRDIEQVIDELELLQERVRGYGEALSDVRRKQPTASRWAFVLAVIAWRLFRRRARPRQGRAGR